VQQLFDGNEGILENKERNESVLNSVVASPFTFDNQTVLSEGQTQVYPIMKYYAMKVMKKDFLIKNNKVEAVMGKHFILLSIIAEREILTKIDHPFFVKMKYSFQTDKRVYMILEFINGGELFFHLRKEKRFDENRARFYSA
jgi:serine/threonine protein kinase